MVENTESTDNKFQVIIITLSNGQVVKATVPAFWDGKEELSVVGLRVTAPAELPPDASWGKLFE